MNFAFPVDPTMELKQKENMDKYLDLATKLKELRSIKVTVVSSVVERDEWF